MSIENNLLDHYYNCLFAALFPVPGKNNVNNVNIDRTGEIR
jgi:hypothetical protein